MVESSSTWLINAMPSWLSQRYPDFFHTYKSTPNSHGSISTIPGKHRVPLFVSQNQKSCMVGERLLLIIIFWVYGMLYILDLLQLNVAPMEQSKITWYCLHTVQQLQRNNTDQSLNSQKTPHSSPSQASYGVCLVSTLETIDCITMGVYFMKS